MESNNHADFFDAFAQYLSQFPRDAARILSPQRLRAYQAVYKKLEALAVSHQWTLSAALHPAQGWGHISLEAEDFVFDAGAQALTWLPLADNFEIYPLADGRLRLSMMFNRLTIKI